MARTICPSCSTKYYPSEDALIDAELKDHAGRSFRKGVGCQQCHDSGFQGRLGIYEVMEVGPQLRRLIHTGAPSHVLRQQFREALMVYSKANVILATSSLPLPCCARPDAVNGNDAVPYVVSDTVIDAGILLVFVARPRIY